MGRTVLVTRAAPQAGATAQKLIERGYCPLLAPLSTVEIAAEAPPDLLCGVQGILVTSQNGAAALARHVFDRSIPILTVGDRTAEAVAASGFGTVRSAGGDAADLSRLALSRFNPQAGVVLHIRGETLARSPLDPLAEQGFATREAVLYRMCDRAGFPAAILPRLPDVWCALVYSPGSARRLIAATAKLAPVMLNPAHIICISAAAAAPFGKCDGLSDAALHIAEVPDEATIFRCLDTL